MGFIFLLWVTNMRFKGHQISIQFKQKHMDKYDYDPTRENKNTEHWYIELKKCDFICWHNQPYTETLPKHKLF